MTHALAFLGVSALVIVTPGPDTALTIRNALMGGRRGGVLTALGVATGQAAWTLAAATGVAVVLTMSEPLFVALRVGGAAYLVFLGSRTLLAALRRRHPTQAATAPAGTTRGCYRQGLISNLGNPKMAVFFTSLLPQFGGTSFAALFALGLVFCTFTLVWLSAYGVALAKAGDVLRRTRIRRTIDAVTGTVLVAFGLRLAADSRA